jgi:hypothetical protein
MRPPPLGPRKRVTAHHISSRTNQQANPTIRKAPPVVAPGCVARHAWEWERGACPDSSTWELSNAPLRVELAEAE